MRCNFYTLGYGAFVCSQERSHPPELGTRVLLPPRGDVEPLQSKVRARRLCTDHEGRPFFEVELYVTTGELGGGYAT